MRCEKCRRWVYAEKKGIIGRFIRTFKRDDDTSDDLGELAEVIRMKPVGKILGKYFEYCEKAIDSPFEAIAGDKYRFHCSCGYEWGTDDDSKDQTSGYQLCLQINELYKQYKSLNLFSKNEIDSYINRISTLLTVIQDYPYLADYNSSLYDLSASVYYFWLHDSNRALISINKSIELCPNDSNSIALRGVFRNEMQEPVDRYKKLQDIIRYKEAEEESPFFSKSEFQIELNNAAKKYADFFLQIPKERRKYLVIDDELRLLPNSFLVLTPELLSILDEAGLEFPNGYASEKALYICHPYKTNKYLDADNYKDELFYDQLEELKELLQCLGAKTIDMVDLKTHETTIHDESGIKIKAGGTKDVISTNAEGESTKDSNYYEKKKKELFQHLEYPLVANVEPHVWSNSAWYSHLSQWQSKARSRLRPNGVTKDVFYLSTIEEILIKENEQLKLKADFDAMIAKGNLEGARSLSFERQESRSHEWEIKVEFYPMSAYSRASVVSTDTKPNTIVTHSKGIQSEVIPQTGKKWNPVWLMGIVIIFLIGVIICLLIL